MKFWRKQTKPQLPTNQHIHEPHTCKSFATDTVMLDEGHNFILQLQTLLLLAFKRNNNPWPASGHRE